MIRLLLLENRSAFAERLAAALSQGGQAECECESLSDFEHRATQDGEMTFDAIVLDLRRDAKNSLKLCRRVIQRASDVPVIAVTAIHDHDEAVRIVLAGAEDVCLRDEFDADTLRNRIRCAVERHRVSALLANEICQPTVGVADSTFAPSTVESGFDFPTAATEDSTLTLACVISPGLESSTASERVWTESLGVPVETTHLDKLVELAEHVTASHSDAVVMYMNDFDDALLDVVATVRAHLEDAIIIVAAPDPESELALRVIQHGADDFVASENLTHETVARYLRQGLARRRRSDADNDQNEDPNGDPRSEQRKSDFEQRSPRYFITKSAIAIPIRPDLAPDQSVRVEGFTVDVSESGIGFDVGELEQLPSELLLAGIEGDDGVLYFATVEVCNWSPQHGRMRVSAKFVTGERDLLRPENLTPAYQPDTNEFAPKLPRDTLLKWASLGILSPVLVDRIFVCPKCEGMSTFRSGCRSCGSIHVVSHQLIHHFACSYLGRVSEFESDGIVTCPKCGVEGTVGSDEFERLNGPCHCLECNWSDTNTDVVGQCMRCNWHFPLKNASERELIDYHVNRLDPQALLGIS